ncbi:hypothetical protein F4818DRAFT_279161 [Hypoxylon cercidicola]|nr:hypothetical protein F4818DRAFT_279161 [Hypoxylon cercidicola]
MIGNLAVSLGAAGGDEGSFSFSHLQPTAAPSDPRSATSRAHCKVHERPPGVGVGWGDYDTFKQWQSYGRLVKKDLVEEGTWSKTINELEFISETSETTRKIKNDLKDTGVASKKRQKIDLHLTCLPIDDAGRSREVGRFCQRNLVALAILNRQFRYGRVTIN